jgi:hypothetical protein
LAAQDACVVHRGIFEVNCGGQSETPRHSIQDRTDET